MGDENCANDDNVSLPPGGFPREETPRPIAVRGTTDGGVRRRTVVAGAAWSVPAVVMMSAAPAYAASASGVLTLSTPNMQIPAAGPQAVTAVVKDSSGGVRSGDAVSFTGPSGSTFSPPSAVTDGSGAATTQVDLNTPWATPGSTVTVTGVSGSTSVSQAFTVLGANAYGVGNNTDGKLGNGSTANLSTPAQLSLVFPSPIVDIASATATSGYAFSLALLKDGTVWGVGANASGQLGDGTTTSRSTWAKIPGLSGVTQIAVGSISAYALTNGAVMAWGNNGSGQLGDGSKTSRTTPVPVSGLSSGVTQIAAGSLSAYALVDGAVKAWGANSYGQLGNGRQSAYETAVVPAAVSGLTSGVTQIAAGTSAGYAVVGGAARAWGRNNASQLGDGSTTNRTTPVAVSGLTSGVTRIASSDESAYALVGDAVKAWGNNLVGQLGNGTTTSSPTPVTVSGMSSGVTQIAAGRSTGYALVGGAVKAWGNNYSGQIGDGSTTNRTTPVTVSGVSGVTALASNGSFSASMFFLR